MSIGFLPRKHPTKESAPAFCQSVSYWSIWPGSRNRIKAEYQTNRPVSWRPLFNIWSALLTRSSDGGVAPVELCYVNERLAASEAATTAPVQAAPCARPYSAAIYSDYPYQ